MTGERGALFNGFCLDFDYHLMTKFWKRFVNMYSHGASIQEIRNRLVVLTTEQLIQMATAFEKQGNSIVNYHAPDCKWDDVHDKLPVELTPKKGPFGVAQVKCEACQRYFTIKQKQFEQYYAGVLHNYLCCRCSEEWENALLTSGA